jgi:hypothetical protein
MEEKGRAYRRHKKKVKFFKRVDDWLSKNIWTISPEGQLTNDKKIAKEKIIKGESATFLHTTTKPCSCEMCSDSKYDRIKVKRETEKTIKEELNYED